MAKVQYTKDTGVLHIGGGRFFYSGEAVEVDEAEKNLLIETYPDLEEVYSEESVEIAEAHSAASLKKLNAEQQKEIIVGLSGDAESVSNEDERIALILELQEEAKEQEEE